MQPTRAAQIAWDSVSWITTHSDRTIPVARGSAEFDPDTGRVHYLDAGTATAKRVRVSAVRRVSHRRGLGYHQLAREIELTADDYLMLAGYELDAYGGLTDEQKHGLLIEHPTIVSVTHQAIARARREADERLAAERIAERRGVELKERARTTTATGPHSLCTHPRTKYHDKVCRKARRAEADRVALKNARTA